MDRLTLVRLALRVETGYTQVTETTQYTSEQGYGWTGITGLGSRDRTLQDNLNTYHLWRQLLQRPVAGVHRLVPAECGSYNSGAVDRAAGTARGAGGTGNEPQLSDDLL